jgi:hypothetical protein
MFMLPMTLISAFRSLTATADTSLNGILHADIAVDSSGNVYVVESGYSRIQKFAPNFVDFPSIIVLVAAILVLTVIFRRKKW